MATSTRDYYEVLGVKKTATQDEIKKRTASWRASTIRTPIPTIPRLKRSSKRYPAPTRSYPTPRSANSTMSGPPSSDKVPRVPVAGSGASRAGSPWGATGPICLGASLAAGSVGEVLVAPAGGRSGPSGVKM